MNPGRAVQMFLTSARMRTGLALLAVPLAEARAGAATLASVLADAQAVAIETGAWIQMVARRVWAGDMDAIQDSSFVLAGLMALLGVWLLIRPPWRMATQTVIALPDGQGVVETASPKTAATERPEHEPPSIRLLEAVAAAQAQFEISEAERKRGR